MRHLVYPLFVNVSCFVILFIFVLFRPHSKKKRQLHRKPYRHEVDADGKPTHVNGLVIAGGGTEEEYREYDVVIAATDVPGIKKLLPENFRK